MDYGRSRHKPTGSLSLEAMSDSWQVLDTVSNRFEAEVLAARLRDSGISVLVRGDDVGGWVPELLQMKGVSVLVADNDLEAARKLLDDTGTEPPAE